MKRWLAYRLNVAALPLFFVISFVQNMVKVTASAFRWSLYETKEAYQSNHRYFAKEKHEVRGEKS